MLALEPEAIGYEMEATGVYSAAALKHVEWIVIKGISDKGYDKNDDHQEEAATASARFTVHMLSLGLLDSRP